MFERFPYSQVGSSAVLAGFAVLALVWANSPWVEQYFVLPSGVSWSQTWAASALAGIGFTMSIFVGELVFSDPALVSEAKIGIILASLAAGIWGAFLLNRSP